jgi:hypothetical protein
MKVCQIAMAMSAIFCFGLSAGAETVSPLFARGYTVVPEPQKVQLQPGDLSFGSDWGLQLGRGVRLEQTAVRVLEEDLWSRFRVRLQKDASGPVLLLQVAADSIPVGKALDRDKESLAKEAYRIELAPRQITITANAEPGLLYGVETLVQMLRPSGTALLLPEGTIDDWPDLHVRHMYWDDAHHLERMDELKRAIRQAAFYKINGFVIKLEGHFVYRHAPAIVEPYALTPAQYQELTDYGLQFNVQVVPYLDAPAHVAFILKHPEYHGLREYPDSNYEMCATNPASYELLYGMFQDLLDANKGGRYFYLSTDEPYYIGLANNSQCQEALRAKELGSVGKLFAEFAGKAGKYLHDRGRTVFFWGEYPMKPEDLPSLPSFLVNGEVTGPTTDRIYKSRGIRQTIYTSSEGEEKFFPDYFSLPPSKRLHGAYSGTPRVHENMTKISNDSARTNADVIGAVNAGWADMGLHPETFWLGYAASLAAAWHPGTSDRETMSSFYRLFYGPDVVNMDRLYQLMSEQAQFWEDSWDDVESKWRKPIWGNSNRIFKPGQPARDQSIALPPLPDADLAYSSEWAQQNENRLGLAAEFRTESDSLAGLLHSNVLRARVNRYNLEVYLSIANLFRQNLDMLAGIGRMDTLLARASKSAGDKPREALALVDQSLETARQILVQRNRAFQDAQATWQKSWHPRVAEANGRRFLHELDDVKDHLPDRTVDMTYLIYRELNLPFGEWVEGIVRVRNQFAKSHNLEALDYRFDWKSVAAD